MADIELLKPCPFCGSGAIADVAAERERQKAVEGWTPDHDDRHDDCSLVEAAVCYAAPLMQKTRVVPEDVFHNGRAQAGDQEWTPFGAVTVPERWPWAGKWWKPKDRRQNLVRAAALIVAEIERLDRANPADHGLSGRQGNTSVAHAPRDTPEPSSPPEDERSKLPARLVLTGFQWNDGWRIWEQVIPEAIGEPGVCAVWLPALPQDHAPVRGREESEFGQTSSSTDCADAQARPTGEQS